MEPLQLLPASSTEELESDSCQIRSDRQVSQKSSSPRKCHNVEAKSLSQNEKIFTMGENQKRFARANPQPSFGKISREFACNLAVALKETNVFTRYQSPCNIHTMKRIT